MVVTNQLLNSGFQLFDDWIAYNENFSTRFLNSEAFIFLTACFPKSQNILDLRISKWQLTLHYFVKFFSRKKQYFRKPKKSVFKKYIFFFLA